MMKRKWKTAVVALLLCAVLPISGCGMLNLTPDYDTMIESFVPSHFNTETLSVGDIHGPQARIWLKLRVGTTAYSSDESVVTVSDLGKVTAVGPGECYVVITAMFGFLFEVYHYTVTP